MTNSKGIKSYLIVFVWLALITIAEIAAASAGLPRQPLIIFVIGTAVAKAAIIALFFMHLKSEKIWIWWMPGVPIILALVFIFALFPDMVYHLTLYLDSHP